MDYLRGKDRYLHQTVSDVLEKIDNLAAQANLNPNSNASLVPATIAALTVTTTTGTGFFAISITDHSKPFPGIHYIVEYSTATNFSPLYQEDLGQSTSVLRYLGTGTKYYFRAYSLYQQGNPSPTVYYGTAQSPTAVVS